MMMVADCKRTVLATDLDGTFLGGGASARAQLYSWIADRREEFIVIFVSGRGLGFMRELADCLPVRPDHVIGNVGTSVAAGPDWCPLADIESWLDARWPNDAPARIAEVLARYPGLTEQPVVEGRRVSRYYSDHVEAMAAQADVEQLGFEVLLSDGQYFDVLPPGVRKGPTLLRTLTALGLARERTLVAGDTLNDLSLFETGLAGVAVGNSEPELVHAVRARPNVHLSAKPGAAGVLEALRAFHERGGLWEHRLS
jgi:hydroxymethylpyrimidine pyrophosphatase-like HAD family hydrolase